MYNYKIFFFLIFYFTIFNKVFGQQMFDYQFIGVLTLDNDPNLLITYELGFNEVDGKILGYSLTDLGGLHETKNIIEGVYDKELRKMSFEEKELLYTKSNYEEKAFCFVNFEGNLKLQDNISKLQGAFKSFYLDKKNCLNGQLKLINKGRLEKIVAKVDKKIQKSKKVDQETKNSLSASKMLNELRINKLSKNENLTLFSNSDTVEISFWDNGKEDGDKINVFQDGKLILLNYVVKKDKNHIIVKLREGANIFKLVALNEGEFSPNTPRIELIDDNKIFTLQSDLMKHESSSITILKK